MWVKKERGFKVIIRKNIIFTKFLMACLEGKTERNVQIEVEFALLLRINNISMDEEIYSY